MNDVARSTERLRSRIRTGGLSLREIAREASVSDSTVRRFVENGSANIRIVTRIEDAVKALDPGVSGVAAKTDVQ